MHIIGLIVENRAGVMQRISGVFARRGFNIETITVAHTQDPDISRITISLDGDDKTLEKVIKQLNKLPEVVKISTFNQETSVIREIALIKVSIADRSHRADILDFVNIFRGKVVDVGKKSLIVELTGDCNKIDAFINMLKPYGIKEMVRTGLTALARGEENGKNI